MVTPPEQHILEFVRSYIIEHDYSPSLAEIAEGIGYASRGSVHRYVTSLLEQGLLDRRPGGERVLVLPEDDSSTIPMQGRIAAGKPIEAVPDAERVGFHERLSAPGLYQLLVKGDSMADIGIADGDIVLIKPARTAENGQVVVALIDGGEATLKRFYRRKRYIELKAENPNYKPQRYAPERIEIQGVLHSAHRFFE